MLMAINLDNYKDGNGNLQGSKKLIEDISTGVNNNETKIADIQNTTFTKTVNLIGSGTYNNVLNINEHVMFSERRGYRLDYNAFDASGNYVASGFCFFTIDANKLFTIGYKAETSVEQVALHVATSRQNIQMLSPTTFSRTVRFKVILIN